VKIRWMIGILVVLGALLYLVWSLFAMLFAAAAFAYLLDPVVDRFEERGRSREFGIVVIFLCSFGVIMVAALVLVPSVVGQIAELSGNIGTYFSDLAVVLEPHRQWLEQRTGYALPFNLEELGDEIPKYLQSLSPDTQETLKGFLSKALSSGLGFVITIVNLALLPIFVFYMLRDWDRMVAAVGRLIPRRYRPPVSHVMSQIDERCAAFVRGQIMVCLLLGVLYSLGLWLLTGIDLPIVIGMLSGVLFIVPYLGTIVGVVLASLLALLKFGFDFHLLLVWGVFGGVQLLEGAVLTPYIVGDKVGLHPLVVMIALIVGGNLLGIWGMLLAIPITAALSVLLSSLTAYYKKSHFFSE